ncbi:hypothetical protein BDM02DRAFT_3124877, partial [Thelephora ganbajun]
DPTCGGFGGFIQSVNEIKLIDVQSMGYTSEDKPHPRGDLRGGCQLLLWLSMTTKEKIDGEG